MQILITEMKNIHWEKIKPFQQMLPRKLDITFWRLKLYLSLLLCTKERFKCIKNLNVRHETLKLLNKTWGNTTRSEVLLRRPHPSGNSNNWWMGLQHISWTSFSWTINRVTTQPQSCKKFFDWYLSSWGLTSKNRKISKELTAKNKELN